MTRAEITTPEVLSDESVVVEFYYGGKNEGFGTFVKLPLKAPVGTPAFGPAYRSDPRNQPHAGRIGL